MIRRGGGENPPGERGTAAARRWGKPLRDNDRSVDVYVHKLRAKLEAAQPDARFIHTHIGFGYRLERGPGPPRHDELRAVTGR